MPSDVFNLVVHGMEMIGWGQGQLGASQRGERGQSRLQPDSTHARVAQPRGVIRFPKIAVTPSTDSTLRGLSAPSATTYLLADQRGVTEVQEG